MEKRVLAWWKEARDGQEDEWVMRSASCRFIGISVQSTSNRRFLSGIEGNS